MFRLLATIKCSKRQQIAILIISFFAYVAGIRNEGNNMLLQQQQPELLRQQQTTIEDSNYRSPTSDIFQQQTTSNFRPSKIINFTPADAAVMPQESKHSYTEAQYATNSNSNSNTAIYNNKNSKNNNNNNNNIREKQEMQNVNRHRIIETAATYGSAAKKRFSFPNEQQQIPQHLTDKPIYVYRDPFTNENYHYTPTEATNAIRYTTRPTTHSHKNYNNSNNNNAYKQQNSHHQQLQHDDNQEYLVQSSMIVGAHQQQQQQQNNPLRPYMSLSYDKDVYLKRPGVVYDEKPNYNNPNSVIDKKSEESQTLKVNKISYDSHDYPPPSYFQQQTSNFLPTPVPTQASTPRRPVIGPTRSPTPPPRPNRYRPSSVTPATIFGQQWPQQQYLSSSQATLPNYANSIDNYLLNKQQTSNYYRTEQPPLPLYLQHHQHQQESQAQPQYESRPPYFDYVSSPQSPTPPYEQQQQYFPRPPSYPPPQAFYPQHEETARPPPVRPPSSSYNNYYDYQIGEIPPQAEISPPPAQQFNYPHTRPPPQYPYQGPYRPPTQSHQQQQQHNQQQNGFATLAQYAPQFTSLLLSGVGVGGTASNTNGPLSSLLGALTNAAVPQQSSPSSSSAASSSSSSSSYNRRPVNSQLIKALENIARNDDLQCVPKVLCQMIAAQTQRGQLPTFITSPAITNFLAGFPAASPALIYGRALLLGLSGGEKSCQQTYVQCPKTDYEIIYYLNNHRGGFFKFFSQPEGQQQTVNHDATQQSPTSLFSILAALTGNPEVTTTTSRPTRKPPAPSTNITGGIGNFFTHLLSDYLGGDTVEYQRGFKVRTKRAKRSLNDKIKFEGESEEKHGDVIKFQDEGRESQRDVLKFKDKYYDGDSEGGGDGEESSQPDSIEDFHDEEDEEDTQQGFIDDELEYSDETEGRILQKTTVDKQRNNFFPHVTKENPDEIEKDGELKKIIKQFNDFNRERKLKFPTENAERNSKIKQGKFLYNDLPNNSLNYGHEFNNYVENSYDDLQKIKFIENAKGENSTKDSKTMVVFPERGGRILNYLNYAASYLQDYLKQQQLEQDAESAQVNDKFITSNIQRPIIIQTEFPAPPTRNAYTNIYDAPPPAHIYNNNNNHFLPTPSPADNDYPFANLNYLNKDIIKESSYYKPHSHTSIITSSTTPIKSNHNWNKPQRYTANSQTNFNKYHSSLYTTRRPYSTATATTKKQDDKNVYVTNSRGVTEYYLTPEGKKVYL